MKPKLADIGTRLDEGDPEALGGLRGRQKSGEGIYSARALNGALAVLDADQIRLELRGGPAT